MRGLGQTQQQIADKLGVSQRTVSGDLNSKIANEGSRAEDDQPTKITNKRGQSRPAHHKSHRDQACQSVPTAYRENIALHGQNRPQERLAVQLRRVLHSGGPHGGHISGATRATCHGPPQAADPGIISRLGRLTSALLAASEPRSRREAGRLLRTAESSQGVARRCLASYSGLRQPGTHWSSRETPSQEPDSKTPGGQQTQQRERARAAGLSKEPQLDIHPVSKQRARAAPEGPNKR